MSTRDIESALADLYGVTVSHDVIARVTDAVLDEVRVWQERPLDAIYPVLWLDELVLKVRHGKQVTNRCAHVVLGLTLRGQKEVLGAWLSESEGAKFWAGVLSELKQRGVRDIYVACMGGLKGLPEAVTALFPQTLTQQCIVHLVRASLRYVATKDMKAVATTLKRVYTSATIDEGGAASWMRSRRNGAASTGRPCGYGATPGTTPCRSSSSRHHLCDQRDRKPEHDDAQVPAQPAHLPQRRIGDEVVVPCDPRSDQALAGCASLEAGNAGPPDPAWRGTRAHRHVRSIRSYTVKLTNPRTSF